MSTAIWALVHGLAFLHLDGKLDTSTPAITAPTYSEMVVTAATRLVTVRVARLAEHYSKECGRPQCEQYVGDSDSGEVVGGRR